MNNIYDDYFSVKNSQKSKSEKKEEKIFPKEKKETKLSAKGSISSIDEMMEIVRKILNAAWGDSWGEIKPTISKSFSLNSLTIPVITYDINSREISEKKPLKPILSDIVYEEVNGEKTGDCFLVYRQWFDCIVEFNIYTRNALESRELSVNFENILNLYIGYLKELGISEMFFLKEIPSDKSINYIQGIPMKSLMYFVRLERVHKVRQSLINKIDINIKTTSDNSLVDNITYDL